MVVNKISSLRIIFEKIMAVNGTIKINELALTAPIFDEAKKYIVFANDITTIESRKIFIQKGESQFVTWEIEPNSQKDNEIIEANKKLQKLKARK